MTEDEFDPSDELTPAEIFRIAGDIIAAHVSNNTVDLANMPGLIANVHGALVVAAQMGGFQADDAPQAKLVPFVSAKASIKPDHIICLECGGKQKILKRHLEVHHHLSPAEYRTKWGLKADYPMVAPEYAARRRELAISLGLGKNAAARAKRLAGLKAKAKKAANG